MSSRAVSSRAVSNKQFSADLDTLLEVAAKRLAPYLERNRPAVSSKQRSVSRKRRAASSTRRPRRAKRSRRAGPGKARRGPAKHRSAVRPRATVTALPKVQVTRDIERIRGKDHVRLTLTTRPGTRVAIESCQRKHRRWVKRAEKYLWTGWGQWKEYEAEWMADAEGVKYRVVVLPGSGKGAKR